MSKTDDQPPSYEHPQPSYPVQPSQAHLDPRAQPNHQQYQQHQQQPFAQSSTPYQENNNFVPQPQVGYTSPAPQGYMSPGPQGYYGPGDQNQQRGMFYGPPQPQHPGWGQQQQPYYPQQGGYYPPQQQPYGYQQNGYYERRDRMDDGCCAIFAASLAACCCLDLLCLF